MNKTVKDTRYILSLNLMEQLMIKVQKTNEVKERERPYLQRRLVLVMRPDKWSHNMMYAIVPLNIKYLMLPNLLTTILYKV